MKNLSFYAGVVAIVMFVIGLLCLLFCLVWQIETGHVGIVKSFGNPSGDVLTMGGPYFVMPWKSVTRVNIQTVKYEEPANVPTSGGLTVGIKAVLVYKIDPNSATKILTSVGQNYEAVIIDPYFKNAVRDVCAEYAPEALYTDARNAVEEKVLARVRHDLEPRGFIIENVMLQDPHLPDVVTGRIQAKVAAEQDALRMAFVFKQREQEGLANKRQKELEAEAKVIEAKGIASAQKIIKSDLDDNYLKYLWVEALKESAKHNNATIYIPTGNDGMPLFKSVHPGKDHEKK